MQRRMQVTNKFCHWFSEKCSFTQSTTCV